MLAALMLAQTFVTGLGPTPGYTPVEKVGGWEIVTNDNDGDACTMRAIWEDGTMVQFGPSHKAHATMLLVSRMGWNQDVVGPDLQPAKMTVSFEDDDPVFALDATAYHYGDTYMVGGTVEGTQMMRLMRSRSKMYFIVGPRGTVTAASLKGSEAAFEAMFRCLKHHPA